MKFKVDENLPAEIAEDIRHLDHEADTVFDEGIAGFPDSKILAASQEAGRILLTMDKGIANITLHPPKNFPGIVLLRPKRTGRLATIEFVRRNFSALLGMKLSGRLIVVSEAGIRTRQ